VAVGRITKPHGVKGEVVVFVLTEVEQRFADGSRLMLEDGRTLTVAASRPDRGKLLVRFEELADRTAVEPLTGAYLFVSEGDVPAAPEDAYWPHQLEGAEVLTESGRSLGSIVEIISTPANDVWVARDGEREILIPALKDVVVSVDTTEKRVVIKEIPGLIDPA
jgi:16S rRNA processing protein RimM